MADYPFSDVPRPPDGFLCEVPAASSKRELLGGMYRVLRAPVCAGRNWDGFYDTLCDMTWIAERHVAIVHLSVPDLTRDDLVAYLRALADAIAFWRLPARAGDVGHVLSVSFPPYARERLQALLRR